MSRNSVSEPIDRVVAFVDILGFRDLVKKAFRGNGNAEVLNQIYSALGSTSAQAITTNSGIFGDPSVAPNLRASAFSDCIVLSDSNDKLGLQRVVSKVSLLASWLLRDGVLCRGGITSGITVHDDRLLFGQGMIDAYLLENEVAVFPRIVVAENLAESSCSLISEQIRRDSDGSWFLDIFYPLLRPYHGILEALRGKSPTASEPDLDGFEKIRSFLSENISAGHSPRRRTKYLWLATQFNAAVERYVPGKVTILSF